MPTLGDLLLGRKSGGLLDLIKQYGSGVKQRVGLLADDPAEFTRQALLDVVPNSTEAQAAQNRLMGGEVDPQAYAGYIRKSMDLGSLLASIRVYHGSPHKFDKFDLSKIGTGEGRQQQAHGAFLAENKATAERYANRLSDDGIGNLYEAQLRWPPAKEVSSPMSPADFPVLSAPLKELGETADKVKSLLSADDIRNLRGYYGWDDVNDAPMQAIIEAMEISSGNNRGAVSRALSDAGIPGIRYLDAGSRSGGAGTHNYVVFDDSLIKLLTRNGAPIK